MGGGVIIEKHLRQDNKCTSAYDAVFDQCFAFPCIFPPSSPSNGGIWGGGIIKGEKLSQHGVRANPRIDCSVCVCARRIVIFLLCVFSSDMLRRLVGTFLTDEYGADEGKKKEEKKKTWNF